MYTYSVTYITIIKSNLNLISVSFPNWKEYDRTDNPVLIMSQTEFLCFIIKRIFIAQINWQFPFNYESNWYPLDNNWKKIVGNIKYLSIWKENKKVWFSEFNNNSDNNNSSCYKFCWTILCSIKWLHIMRVAFCSNNIKFVICPRIKCCMVLREHLRYWMLPWFEPLTSHAASSPKMVSFSQRVDKKVKLMIQYLLWLLKHQSKR